LKIGIFKKISGLWRIQRPLQGAISISIFTWHSAYRLKIASFIDQLHSSQRSKRTILVSSSKFFDSNVNFQVLKPVAFAATGFAFPPSADNFIYGFTPAELRQNITTFMLL
jgi:hypothetical protein